MVSFLAASFVAAACPAWLIAAGGPSISATAALADVSLMAPAKADQDKPLIVRLDPVRRTKVLMVLVGLVLVGVALVAFTVIAGRRVLRIARTSHGPTRPAEDDWYRKPLIPNEPDAPSARDSK